MFSVELASQETKRDDRYSSMLMPNVYGQQHLYGFPQPQGSIGQLSFPVPINNSAIVPNQSTTEWYTSSPVESNFDSAQVAYNEARDLLRDQLTDAECALIWSHNPATIQDVEKVVTIAKEKYDKKHQQSKVLKWLSSCSSRIMYYGVIMDTLAQHHPEYVSLAWGAFKFLFMAVLQHEELLTQISKTVSKIADILPRADLSSNLYKTKRMQQSVAQLYAKIMEFIKDAVKWYKMGKIKHSLTAVTKPYVLSFKNIVDEISEASRKVDKEAAAASQAEIRDLHLQLIHLTRISTANFDQQLRMTTSISTQLAGQMQWQQNTQISQIKSLKIISSLSAPQESLDFCRSLRLRRMTPALGDPSEIAKLKEWHYSRDGSPVAQALARGVPASARDFAVDYIDILLANKVPVAWVLPHTNILEDDVFSMTDVLLKLIVQILDINMGVLTQAPFPVSIHHFHDIDPKARESEEQCFEILGRCLQGVQQLYIVIDVTFIGSLAEGSQHRAREFLARLRDVLVSQTAPGVKLMLTSWKSNGLLAEGDSEHECMIYVDGRSPVLSRRRINHSTRASMIGRTAFERHFSPS